jgi:coatomer protein complex subunit gamma
VAALEKALGTYIQGPTESAFDIKSVPLATALSEEQQKPMIGTGGVLKSKPVEPKKVAQKEVSFADDVAKVSALARVPLGGLFKTCEKQQLTESETEYVVSCTKHIFSKHFVLQVSPAREWVNFSIKPRMSVLVWRFSRC